LQNCSARKLKLVHQPTAMCYLVEFRHHLKIINQRPEKKIQELTMKKRKKVNTFHILERRIIFFEGWRLFL
jgi:hypothetical protein